MNIPRHIQQYTGYTARIKRLPFLCIVRDLGTMLAGPLPFYTAHSRLKWNEEGCDNQRFRFDPVCQLCLSEGHKNNGRDLD